MILDLTEDIMPVLVATLPDIFQLITTMIMSRILTPNIYGSFALIQTVFLIISSGSSSIFVNQSYEAENKEEINWGLMMGGAIIVNTILIITMM
jgi:O-antigen/teichoic acid export membrane protein